MKFSKPHWHSLKTRVTLITVLVFVFSLWTLTLYASRLLREDLQRQLGEQQFMSVSLIADHLDEELVDRMRALEAIAAELTPIMGRRAEMQTLLEHRPLLQLLFNGGIFATDSYGSAIADVPLSAGRIGTNYMDRDSVAIPLKQGKPMFGRPAMGKKLGAPIFSITVPIRDAQGRVSGCLVGTINLGQPNFFENIVNRNYGKTGGYYLIAREHRLFVTASDKTRVMQPLPATGVNPFLDRVLQGYQGYGITTGSRGIEALASAKRIPSADWLVAATLPTTEAFATIQDMLQHLFLAALILTLLAGAITWWSIARLLRYQLAPVMSVSRTLNRVAKGDPATLQLPVVRPDEIGEMINGFNRLLAINAHREAALKDSEAFGRGILDSVDAQIAVLDHAGVILAVNEPWRRFALENGGGTELPIPALEVGANYLSVCRASSTVKPSVQDIGQGIASVLDGSLPKFNLEYACHSPQQQRWFSMTATPLQGTLQTGAVIAHVNITERKAAQEQIQSLASTDALTGLPNRRLLMLRLQQAMAANLRRERHGALLLIDLDDFKTLNDTQGHHQGDLLLQQVAKRLTDCVREGDTVARLGGDEFVTLLEDLSANEQEAATQSQTVAEKILATLDQIYQLENSSHYITPSIGIALFGDGPEDIDEPLKHADLAMYRAKAMGGNTLRFFNPRMQTEVTNRVAIEAQLREAVQRNQFVLHYQAQVTGGQHITGVEALLRWQDPQRGLVTPAEFISVAEKTGLILPLGHWVLETACAQLALWGQQPALAHLTMAVNVSARQFRQSDFVEQVLSTLARSGARADRLKIELTESLLVASVDDVSAKMNALKAQGVRFALDDFGTGYSSLSYLKRLPLDQLKIDQGFVRDILIDPDDAAIARLVIVLADSLGLEVIAEGVETQAQLAFLERLGCHSYQGYLISEALPIEELELFLRKNLAAGG